MEPQGDGVLKDTEGQLLTRREPHWHQKIGFADTLLTSCGT